MLHSVYKEEQILDAIEKEGLAPCAWGFKTPRVIFIYSEGQEKDDVWKDLKPSLKGFEPAHWDANILAPVNYYFIDQSRPSENRFCDTEANDVLCIDYDEDDEIIVRNINNALEWLDEETEFFSEPTTVSDMREWIKEKLL